MLHDKERERDALASVAHYIRENPVRAGLVCSQEEWPYSGSILPGYPSLDPGDERFEKVFWNVVYEAYEKGKGW